VFPPPLRPEQYSTGGSPYKDSEVVNNVLPPIARPRQQLAQGLFVTRLTKSGYYLWSRPPASHHCSDRLGLINHPRVQPMIRSLALEVYKCDPPDTHLCMLVVFFLILVMQVKFIVAVLFVLASQVLSNTITADTTSGRLLGSQTDGGMSWTLASDSCTEVTHWTSRVLQRHRKIPPIFILRVT
jgi:hypothetical protein